MTALIFLFSCNSGKEPNVIVVRLGAVGGVASGVLAVICLGGATVADDEGKVVGQKQGERGESRPSKISTGD